MREVRVDARNVAWATDITHVETQDGWLYMDPVSEPIIVSAFIPMVKARARRAPSACAPQTSLW